MAPPAIQFPLGAITGAQLQVLGQVLWSWPLIDERTGDKSLGNQEDRSKRLGRFFEYYRGLTASYEPDVGSGERPSLRTHEDVFEMIRILKEGPNRTRAELLRIAFPTTADKLSPSISDQERAINLAVKIMLMINCSAERPSCGLVEDGAFQTPWRSDVTLTQYVNDSFPLTDHPSLNDEDELKSLNIKSSLAAKKLKKHAGVKFRPTDDLCRHLKFDHKTAVVEIYHHTALLKEHLRLTKDKHEGMTVTDALKRGALPRQLALETLDSIQKILFPLSDPRSRSLLRSLSSTSSFDPDTLRFESASIRNDDEKDIRYHYFGTRLVELYEELENPTPRGMEKWFERRSGARYVMMATLIGVLIAIMFGMVGLALSSYQAWLAYQQWQHPLQVAG